MTQDEEKVVQQEAPSEGDASTEETQTQPSIEEQIAKAMEGQLENLSRTVQSHTDKAISRIQREAETMARITEDAMAALDATSGDETDVPKPKPRVQGQYRSQLEVRRQQEAAVKQTVDAFESNIRQHIVDLRIDPDDKRIEWGDSNNLSLTDRQGKILASVSKIQGENAKLAEEKRKQEFTDLEAKLRKDLGLDTVDTTTSAGVVSASDAEFMDKFGSGELPTTKANVDRYEKIQAKYK